MINGKLEKLIGPLPKFDFQLKYSNKEGTEWYGVTSSVDLVIKDYNDLPFEIEIMEDFPFDAEPDYLIHKEAKDFKCFYEVMRHNDKFIFKEIVSYKTISMTLMDDDWMEVTHECEVGCNCNDDKQPLHYDRYIVDVLEAFIMFPSELDEIWSRKTFPEWHNSW